MVWGYHGNSGGVGMVWWAGVVVGYHSNGTGLTLCNR